MKLYGVDLRALPVDERSAVREGFNEQDIAADIIFSKSGDISAIVIYWDEPAAFPSGFKIPLACSYREIAAGNLAAYQAAFR